MNIAVELCYRSRLFLIKKERLEHLFKLYEEMKSKEIDYNSNSNKNFKK